MVNIFIIVPDIQKTAELLDQQRLGKQRVECKQIIDVLERYDTTKVLDRGWSSHPATRSWVGYTNHLKVYFNIIVREWIRRGFVNNMDLYQIDESLYHVVPCSFDGKSVSYDLSLFNQYSFPFWVSFPPFYMSHQAALCRKNPSYYKFLLRKELDPFLNNGYLWTSNVTMDCYTNWNFSFHEPLACGCPAIYRISTTDVLKWIKSPFINPKTNNKISEKGAIYKDLKEAMEKHKIIIYNSFIYYENNPICSVYEIDKGLSLLESYYQSMGGYPQPFQLVYKLASGL
uniref:Uncharacterized protein n=1 Tax=viral metagenome TaxID=1070528 RepID=A0A6C0BDP3_9ZZZZ